MALVDHQHDLHFLVDVQQSLHEERVRDLVLLSLVVLETRTVVECHLLNHNFGGDGSLRVLFVADFDSGLFHRVEDGFQSVESDHQLRPCQERHDGALAHTRVSDHDHRLVVLFVDWNRLHPCVDEFL